MYYVLDTSGGICFGVFMVFCNCIIVLAMNKIVVFLLTLFLVHGWIWAQHPNYMNPQINGVNRLPARAFFVPYESEPEALKKGHSSREKSLNGTWKFHWSKNPQLRPEKFYEM